MPLTEERLRAAAMQAAAEPGVQAVVLFGSRARRTHRKASDWDVCVVGVGDRARAEQALGLAFEEQGEVDLLCADTDQVLRGASQGTVWAGVVIEGQVLAGDSEILREIEVQPVRTDTAGETMANIRVAIVRGLQATVSSGPNEDVHGRNARMREGTRASADAAEMVTRMMMALAGVQPSGGHLVARHAEILERHAATQGTETARELVRAMARLARRMNGGTQRAHNALYHGQADPEKTWRERVFRAMATHAALIEGLLAGEGPLAGLKQHAQRQALAETMHQTARDVRESRQEFSKRYGIDADEVVIKTMEQWCERCEQASAKAGSA